MITYDDLAQAKQRADTATAGARIANDDFAEAERLANDAERAHRAALDRKLHAYYVRAAARAQAAKAQTDHEEMVRQRHREQYRDQITEAASAASTEDDEPNAEEINPEDNQG